LLLFLIQTKITLINKGYKMTVNNTPAQPVQAVQPVQTEKLSLKDSVKHNWNNHKVNFLLANASVTVGTASVLAGLGIALGAAFLVSNPIGWAVLGVAVAAVAGTALASLIMLTRKVTIEKPVAQIQQTPVQPQGIKAKVLAAANTVKNKAIDFAKPAIDAVKARPKLAATVGGAIVVGALAYAAHNYLGTPAIPGANLVANASNQVAIYRPIDPTLLGQSKLTDAPTGFVRAAYNNLPTGAASKIEDASQYVSGKVNTVYDFVRNNKLGTALGVFMAGITTYDIAKKFV
jgi:hypothetical protein